MNWISLETGLEKDLINFRFVENRLPGPLDDGLVNVTYKQLKYDKEKVIRDNRKNLVPYGEKFITIFIKCYFTHIPSCGVSKIRIDRALRAGLTFDRRSIVWVRR